MYFTPVDDADSIDQPPSSVSDYHAHEQAEPSTHVISDIIDKVSSSITQHGADLF